MSLVTCVGIAVHDVIFRLPTIPSGPGKNHTTERVEIGGGVAANAAVAIARLGGESRLVGALGDDQVGAKIKDDLTAESVDSSRISQVPGVMSPLSAIVVDDDGERMIVNHTDPTLFDNAPLPPEGFFAGSNAVLVDVRWPAAAESALGWARRQGVPGVLDFDVGYSDIDHLIDLASHVVFSRDALRDLVGEDDPIGGLQAIASRTEAWLAVTLGPQGTAWLEGDADHHEPAFDVDVVDTTGAGDVYHGAFALTLADNGDDPSAAVRFASAAAALTCTSFGGRSGIPTRLQVEQLMSAQR